MKKLIIILIALIAFPVFGADEYGITWTRASQHQTTNTTWTPSDKTIRVNTLFFNVSNAGTTWVITVKSKEGTPKILWSGTATVGNFAIFSLPVGVEVINGLDVSFTGTAGVADFWIAYR